MESEVISCATQNDNLGLRLINGDFSDKQNSICCPNATDRPLMDSFITALDVKWLGEYTLYFQGTNDNASNV